MHITLDDIQEIVFANKKIDIDNTTMQEVEKSYNFLHDFAADKIIYGINTGFGPMAQWRVDDDDLRELQYNIIRSHSTGAGEPLSDTDVKAAMIARLGSFIQARSGIHPSLVTLLKEFINRNIIPFIPCHGSVGASGDLVQLAHIALCLIGEGRVHYQHEWRCTADVLKEYGLQPAKIYIREGLSVTNGTSVMTGIGAINCLHAENLLKWAVITSVWMNEIAESYDDLMSEPLNKARRHSGQQQIAQQMREIASNSKRLRKREHSLYGYKHTEKIFQHKIQAYYSLRCTPQILGPILETIQTSKNIIEQELNAASDNPIVDHTTQNVYHGGNFHGDYISLEQDKLKIALTRLTMTAERQLNYLFHNRINDDILPPFLNKGTLGLNYGMQACQFTATSTTAECQTLSMPNYVHSIPNNNDNQDIVSMGTNSALLCRQVIDNSYQVMAILLIALAQATDCLADNTYNNKPNIPLSDYCSTTQHTYRQIREIIDCRVDDQPFYQQIEQVISLIKKL